MTHTGTVSIGDGDLRPWQQPRDTIRTFFQSQFDDVISESSSCDHRTCFPEIDSVADANVSLVCRKEADDIEEEPEEDEDENGGNRKSTEQTQVCSFNQGKTSCDKLRTFACTCRQCYCTSIDEGESGVMSSWGGPKKIRTLNSGVSMSKRKPYTSVFQRPGGEYKFKPFDFRHTSDIHDHMNQYRKYHTVADVGKEKRPPPTFGVDVPDPYAVKIKNICSIVDSCDFTALLAGDNDNSCSDFNSVISATSSDSGVREKDKEREKGGVGGKSRRKKGEKPPLVNTRSVPTLVQGRQKKGGKKSDGQTTRADEPKTLRNYVEEYEELRRERESLQKSNTLPQILLQESVSGRSRPNSDSSSVTHRLLDGLDSPFRRLLQCKYNRGAPVEFLRETYHEKSTSVKLSEFLSQALLGDDRLRTGPKNVAIKPEGKVKVKTKDNQKGETHFPELVGQPCETKSDSRSKKSEPPSCQQVVSLSLEDVETSKHRSIRSSANAVAEDKIPMEYKAKKRKMHKIVDLMSIAR